MDEDDRIKLLEEHGCVLEEKIKRLTQMIDDLTYELGNFNAGKTKKRKRKKKEAKKDDASSQWALENGSVRSDIKTDKNNEPIVRLDMSGNIMENICLGAG